MSAPSAISYKVVGCLLMAGLPVLWLIGGGTRSASCSSALNSRSRGASLLCLDGSFQEWCCGVDGRSWRFGPMGGFGVSLLAMRRNFLFLAARRVVRTREESVEGPARSPVEATLTFSRLAHRRPFPCWLPPPTSATIDAAGEAYLYISTALAPPPRCGLTERESKSSPRPDAAGARR